ncbi:retinoblastoma-related protein isoform X2 [Asparagus officinalis]|uniref:retinoblastoma-related protein isoform X2 n=1 Tax=Asparagus officinalis TaxID=4686 RepID=UPI00098E6860|nr:retinoblastoma-related protein isoform X2 [Asparagus officinalis]
MEDVKPGISSRSDEGGAIEARFSDLCKNDLGLDESAMRQAMVFFRESKHILMANMSAIGSGSPEEVERFWGAFVVYCVTRLTRGRATKENEENGVPLCQILRAFKLNVVDFFKEIPQLALKAGYILSGLYGSDWEKRLELKELQANFVHLSLLSRYYKRAYQEFFKCNSGSVQHSAVSSSTGYVSDYHRFGWLLFLALRLHAFGRFKDLVTCTNGLVSILAVLILHVPIQLRNFKIRDSPLLAKKSDKGINLLASLCNIYQTSEDEVKSTMEKVNNIIVNILKKEPCPASECKSENLDFIVPDGLMYFEDLLEETYLNSSLYILEKDYENAIHMRGELDERMFIDENDSVLGSGSLSGGAINMCSRKPNSIAIGSPAKTPLQFPTSPVNGNHVGNSITAISTPVSAAMTTAKWLRDVISPLPSKPSSELQCFLSACDKDLTADVTRRATIILAAIFPSSTFERSMPGSLQSANLMDSIWAEQRKMEAMKLYFRVLEAMCRAESQVLNYQNGDPQTPKRHCSESNSVLVERNTFTSPVKERLLSASGLKMKLPPLQSAFASPTRPNPAAGGETCAETGINIFFSKIVKLAAIRIRSLSERLQLSQQILERIYSLIQRILSQRTALFFNRHIDQLILCCFYGVAKISQLSLTFKEIIYHYRKQPQCKSQVFRSVFVSWPSTSRNGKVGQDHIDIITFYNEIFIPTVKPLLVELASTGVTQEDNRSTTEDKNDNDGQLPGSPRFPPFPNLPDMSPKKVSASHNVYVSPLRSSKMDSLRSPSSKSYYACVGESTHAFQSPSKDLTAINNRLNSVRKINGRLNFDLVRDSVVAGSLDPSSDTSSPVSAAPLKVLVKCEQPES